MNTKTPYIWIIISQMVMMVVLSGIIITLSMDIISDADAHIEKDTFNTTTRPQMGFNARPPWLYSTLHTNKSDDMTLEMKGNGTFELCVKGDIVDGSVETVGDDTYILSPYNGNEEWSERMITLGFNKELGVLEYVYEDDGICYFGSFDEVFESNEK